MLKLTAYTQQVRHAIISFVFFVSVRTTPTGRIFVKFHSLGSY